MQEPRGRSGIVNTALTEQPCDDRRHPHGGRQGLYAGVVGGHILIHDSRKLFGTPAAEFNRGWVGPTQLVDELVEDDRVELIDAAHSLTIWRKV